MVEAVDRCTFRAFNREMRFRLLAEKSLAAGYETFIRKLASDLWNARIGSGAFEVLLVSHIQAGLRRAWEQGAKQAGLKPDELTKKEIEAMNDLIMKEIGFVNRFSLFISMNSRARGGSWRAISNRVKLWGRRYNDARNRAKAMASNDPKLEWQVGNVKNSCESCLKLNGKVKRASYWEERGIVPQSPPNENLLCGGYKCGCELVPTDKPLSKGPLPKLP